ncbi:MAG TPA: helix-turn-helix transcriptional regulator [Gemmatimonadaceae bacterium]
MESVVRSVKRACAAGLDSVTLRRTIADRLLPALSFDAHAFGACDPDTGLMTHVVADGVPPRLVQQYVEHYYPEYCARLAMDGGPNGDRVFSMSKAVPEIAAVKRANGIRFDTFVSLVSGGRIWGTWCLMRLLPTARTTARDEALLRALAPHMARGLQAAALVDRGLAAQPDEDDSAPGVLVLDARNRLVLRTPIALRLLHDLADVGIANPYEVPLCVMALVSRLRSIPADLPRDISVRTRGMSGHWYVLRASLAEANEYGDNATVIVVRRAVPREVATILTTLYELSGREREVIAEVLRGGSTKEIAVRLGVSPHTVDEHIERACQKIGARGRKALVAKLFFDGYAPFVGQSRPALPTL